MQNRKATYRLYPNKTQAQQLERLLWVHKELWNAALQERIDAWAKAKKSISYEDQCKSLTQIRGELPEDWATSNCSSQQITLRRLNKAFQAFFARCAKGQTPGFPRFKSIKRMQGFGYKGHGDGWRFTPKFKNQGKPDDFGNIAWDKHGTLRLQGVGCIKARGQARSAGAIKSCELMHSHGQWTLSVTLACADVDVARVRVADQAFGADWGVSRLLTMVRTDVHLGEVREDIENPRWFKQHEARLVLLDQAVSRCKRYSKNWRKASKVRSAFKSKMARKRHDHQHQITASIASRAALFAAEALSVKNMTASAAGTIDKPGKNVAQKSGLNREILDTAPSALYQKFAYKVLETGGEFVETPTRKLKPSQTCPACGLQKPKTLAMRIHTCANADCGHTEDRDSAGACVNLRWALGTLPKLWSEKKSKQITDQGAGTVPVP